MSRSNDSLTLYDIESGLQEAVSRLEDAMLQPDQEEANAAEQALQAYLREEVRKVDGITGYIRFCEAQATMAKSEAQRLSDRATAWQNRVDRVKAMTLGIMQAFDVPKFETALSCLRRQKNGGVVSPLIVEPVLIPETMVRATIELTLQDWRSISVSLPSAKIKGTEFMMTEIRKALESGQNVPGAQAGERGEHLRVG